MRVSKSYFNRLISAKCYGTANLILGDAWAIIASF